MLLWKYQFESNVANLKFLSEANYFSRKQSFLDCVQCQMFKNTTVRKPVLLLFADNEARNVVDPLDRAILSLGAIETLRKAISKESTRLGSSLPEDEGRADFKTPCF
jgi:hypothetical protein